VRYFAAKPGEETAKKRYNFYGIAMSKKAAFESGGRPVIYLPEKEAAWVPDDQKWRHVRFDDGQIEFAHEYWAWTQ
jgi:hypothetical protein